MIFPDQNESKLIMKLVSLLIALVVWVRLSGTIHEQETIQVFPQVNLLYDNLGEGLKVKADYYQIQVTLSGLESELKALDSKEIKVLLNLEDLNEGTYNLPTPTNVHLPPRYQSLKVVSVTPEAVKFQLVHYTKKKLKIYVSAIGEPAENFEFKEMILMPPEVNIEGPTNRVKDLEILIADPVNIEGLSKNKEGQVSLNFEQQMPRDTVILENLQQLRYVAVIQEITQTRTVETPYPLQVEEGAGYKVAPAEVKLKVSGPITVVKWFDPSWVKPQLSKFSPNGDDEGATPGGEGETRPLKIPVTAQWQIPDTVKEEHSDWALKLEKLILAWTPGDVEVRFP